MIDTAKHELAKLKAVVKKTSPMERQISPTRDPQNPIMTDELLLIEFNQQILDFSSVISVIAEIRSHLHRENASSVLKPQAQNSSAFKSHTIVELRRTADIYLRS